MSIQVRLHNTGKVELNQALSSDRSVLRGQIAKLTRVFVEAGNSIHVCRPAFAIGCEMRPSTIQAIRAEGRK